MKLLFASAECAPFFKTGGLGDVIGALPKELAKKDIEVAVVLPLHKTMPAAYREQCEHIASFSVDVGWRNQFCGIERLQLNNVAYYFIDNLYYFNRDNLYGYYDDGERFAFFQLALIEMMQVVDYIPDIIHLNDFHTAMVPFLLNEKYHWIESYQSIRTVLTIHNIEFQGQYSPEVLADLFGVGDRRYHDGTIRYENDINFLKAGIVYADRVNTVSHSYAREIQTSEFGCGLEGILQQEKGKLSGIVNGLDYEINNPESDSALKTTYSLTDLNGKKKCKKELQEIMGLPIREDAPIIAVVSRLTHQKGFHLVLEELENLLQYDVQFVLLGTGDPAFEHQFQLISEWYPNKCSINITFDVTLAQKIYAGADIFLMPSRFEPCGLSQLISMRYGTLPVVHEIGGLKDTVEPYNPIEKTGTGFGFSLFTPYYMMEALKKAIHVYQLEKDVWKELMKNAMSQDFSWETSTEHYLSLYKEIYLKDGGKAEDKKDQPAAFATLWDGSYSSQRKHLVQRRR
ncbi:glycogen synthase GlgA [Oceanobacillus sp. J11TS1]|uniref:glycogen synthase GlgA n=1 Tax=Oceanobacillus sp. J11TS1 TaxID=2807191 RepID=UPI001B29B8AF|nr:glycogen synthase GlgA [Oceanobacillus sp. J11TS1]GIO23572.1 glycogen synthase [Oceanobacillus sp. J11TS1]